jgi:NAD/NADP transhydrogenase beta subunit
VEAWQTFAYIAASILFITGLKMLGRAETAKRGNACPRSAC